MVPRCCRATPSCADIPHISNITSLINVCDGCAGDGKVALGDCTADCSTSPSSDK